MSKSRQQRPRAIGLHALLIPLALIWVFPLWMMAVFATLPDHAIFSPNIVLWFGTSFFDNISNLQADTDFLRAMFVSIVVGIIYTHTVSHADGHGRVGTGAVPVLWQINGEWPFF